MIKPIKKAILRHENNCVNIPFPKGRILEVNNTHIFFEFDNRTMAWFSNKDSRCAAIINKLHPLYKNIIYELSQ